MNSSELIASWRLSGLIPDSDVEFTDARGLLDLYAALSLGLPIGQGRTLSFSSAVVESRQGYWRKRRIVQTVAGRTNYRIPDRAVTGSLELIEIRTTPAGSWFPVYDATSLRAGQNEISSNATEEPPVNCVVNGDQIVLTPAPASIYDMRQTYYLRPSHLVTPQNNTPVTGGTDRGRITVVDTTTRQLTVNVMPFDMDLAVPVAITTANQLIDVVRPTGWHELALVGSTQTIAALVITLPAGSDMSEIEVGDYVRAAEQTDWPCLPDEHHRSLADLAASMYARTRGYGDTEERLLQAVGASLRELRTLLMPRIKASPPVIVRRTSLSGRQGWPWPS